MLNISDEAAVLIRTSLGATDLPAGAGLRLGTDDKTGSLAMSLAPLPRERDVVVAHNGASLFLSPVAAERVADQTLSAQITERPAFYVD